MFDIVFLSNGEPHAEVHWKDLTRRFPMARRVDGVVGIRAAHQAAARIARTAMLWTVDADNEVLPSFRFDLKVAEWDRMYVHLMRARNAVNGLEYGWGAIKLFPRRLLMQDDQMPGLDMTTSFAVKHVPLVASVTHFNTSAEAAWRSAFRECVKLSVSDDPDAPERLHVWMTRAEGPYAEWVLRGACDGASYGRDHIGDMEALMRINDWLWLGSRFQEIQ